MTNHFNGPKTRTRNPQALNDTTNYCGVSALIPGSALQAEPEHMGTKNLGERARADKPRYQKILERNPSDLRSGVEITGPLEFKFGS